jgi:hypothetical protein
MSMNLYEVKFGAKGWESLIIHRVMEKSQIEFHTP